MSVLLPKGAKCLIFTGFQILSLAAAITVELFGRNKILATEGAKKRDECVPFLVQPCITKPVWKPLLSTLLTSGTFTRHRCGFEVRSLAPTTLAFRKHVAGACQH